jgi:hypothetical protein
MLVKLLAILFILVGIAGLILPVMPGILLITIGILLLYRERHEEIGRLINEKAPTHLADFYNDFLHKIVAPRHYIGVDWAKVKKDVLRTEKIDTSAKDERSVKIASSLGACIRKARSLVESKYTFVEKGILVFGPGFVELEGNTRLYIGRIQPFIKGADRLVLFVVTIGDALEKEAGLLTSGADPLSGYLLDRIGSFAVESLAENLENGLRRDYLKQKRSLSSRFSPGYCDWPVEEQFKLSKVIDFSKAGVSLTEGCMMVPKKSVSAIAAVAAEGIFHDLISSCDICEQSECFYRRNS